LPPQNGTEGPGPTPVHGRRRSPTTAVRA